MIIRYDWSCNIKYFLSGFLHVRLVCNRILTLELKSLYARGFFSLATVTFLVLLSKYANSSFIEVAFFPESVTPLSKTLWKWKSASKVEWIAVEVPFVIDGEIFSTE